MFLALYGFKLKDLGLKSHSKSWISRTHLGFTCPLQDFVGEAPIHKAARSGSLECIQVLLIAGAKPQWVSHGFSQLAPRRVKQSLTRSHFGSVCSWHNKWTAETRRCLYASLRWESFNSARSNTTLEAFSPPFFNLPVPQSTQQPSLPFILHLRALCLSDQDKY